MRIALYLRVSTPNQRQAQTIEQQLDQLQPHLQERQWTVAQAHIFRDDGFSGASLNRPGLDRLRDCVRNRELDMVLITAPDRLARHYIHQMVLLEEFERGGCQVEFLERPMSQDPHDQLVLQIRSAVAEYERTLITERMRRGRLMKLRAGTLVPWTHPLYGYQVHPDRPRDPSGMTLDPTEAAIVAELFAQYLEQDMSLHRLSRSLHERGIPSPTNKPWWGLATIRGLLTNPHLHRHPLQQTHALSRTADPSPSTGGVRTRLAFLWRLRSGSQWHKCPPLSVKSNLSACRPSWRTIRALLGAITPPTTTCCVPWSVAGAVPGPVPLALQASMGIISVPAKPNRCTGAPRVPVTPALFQRHNWMKWSGKTSVRC